MVDSSVEVFPTHPLPRWKSCNVRRNWEASVASGWSLSMIEWCEVSPVDSQQAAAWNRLKAPRQSRTISTVEAAATCHRRPCRPLGDAGQPTTDTPIFDGMSLSARENTRWIESLNPPASSRWLTVSPSIFEATQISIQYDQSIDRRQATGRCSSWLAPLQILATFTKTAIFQATQPPQAGQPAQQRPPNNEPTTSTQSEPPTDNNNQYTQHNSKFPRLVASAARAAPKCLGC